MAAGLIQRRPRLTLALAVVAGFAVSAVLRALPPQPQALERSPVVRAVLEDPGSPAVGPTDASVTVVVFTDYRCPICRVTDAALTEALARDPDLRVVYKDWPIFGAASEQMARIALAAARQGRYGAMHTALMRANGAPDAEGVSALARSAGLDPDRLEADLAAHRAEIDAQIARQAHEAWSLGLEGTPAYVIGLRLYQGRLEGPALRRAIDRARRAPNRP